MRILTLPWLEISIVLALLGSCWTSRQKQPARAALLGMLFTGAVFLGTLLCWLDFALGVREEASAWPAALGWLGRRFLQVDELTAPLVPAIGLLHFVTALATARSKMRYFSFSWSLASEPILLAAFGTQASWLLVGLLILCVAPPFFELANRRKPTRVYAIHMLLFSVLLVLGWAGVERSGGNTRWLGAASIPLMLAVLIRCGTVPAHCWVTDWFEHSSFGNGLLFVTPLAGVLAAVRLVIPVAPDWVLSSIAVSSLATAVYAAAMGTIQNDARRLFAYLFLSNTSLVLVGLELHTELSLTASLCLWFSAILSLGGFGLTLRAMEARFGRLGLNTYHGLYPSIPTLAVCFLITGLACVGFPGTLGFISAELLVDSAVVASPWVGVCVVAAGALNGIAVMRAYFSLFTGTRHHSTISLRMNLRERVAVLTLAALILGGGIYSAPGVNTRVRAAVDILKSRERTTGVRFVPIERAGQAPAHATK